MRTLNVDFLHVHITDEPGAGGANHRYEVHGFNTVSNQSRTDADALAHCTNELVILFQNGPIKERGVNGVTQEVLLEIVADRLRSFQAGPFANLYNACALDHVEKALEQLRARTKERESRGVEGTHQQ